MKAEFGMFVREEFSHPPRIEFHRVEVNQ